MIEIDTVKRRRAIGVELLPDGAVHARVWAPHAQDGGIAVVIEGGPGSKRDERVIVPLTAEDRGYFSGGLPGAAAGTRYRFQFGGDGELVADPASRFQPEGVHGPSQVVDPAAFAWEVDHWDIPPFRDWVIYELHVGAFTREGTFAAIVPCLPYLKDLGVTAIELMPIAQFPGNRNWGYDAVFPFATQDSYGGPDGLRLLVDAAHLQGIAVLLDVIYNHLGPEGSVVHRYGPYFTAHYRTPWGDALNFDGPASDEVRAFFIESALMWLEEYRIDGFRIDAVHQIYDPQAQPFLAELADAVHGRAAELGRRAVLIAESDLNDTKIILPRGLGGDGLDAQWADDFCHALEAQLVGESSPYTTDFGEFGHLATAMRQAFVYTGQYSEMRQRRFGRAPQPATSDQFVVFLQNHDQVGNRPGGLRLNRHITFAQYKLGAATLLLSPFVPMLFMGEEYGEPNPFLYVTDHGDLELVAAVRAGRQADFPQLAGDSETNAPDPQAVSSFERSRVQIGLHDDESVATAAEHRALYDLYHALLALRRAIPTLTDPRANHEVIARDEQRVLLIHRTDPEETEATLAILAFGDEPTTVTLPIPAGAWTKRFDAGDQRLGGTGNTAPERIESSGDSDLTLPAHAALLYTRNLPVDIASDA